jgi:bla regulator protein blaR1
MTRDVVFLLNHFWQSTLIAALAWAACASVFKANSPGLRFGIYVTASLKFLVPFALLVEAGRWSTFPRMISPAQSREVFEITGTGTRVLAPATFGVVTPPQKPTNIEELLFTALVIGWALGASVVFGRWLRHWITIRKLARGAEPAGMFRGVRLLRSKRMRDERIEPGVFGLWRQSILIPQGIEEHLTPAQLQAVLAHEWQHARRRDNLTAWLHVIVQALFWFHPLVWIVGRRLADEREMACDQGVLKSADPDDYAEAILTVCKFYFSPSHSHATGITSANLKARIEAIVKNEKPREMTKVRRWALAATVASLLLAAPLVGWLTAQAAAIQQGNSFIGLATSAEKRFDVASIKENVSGLPGFQLGPPRLGGITIINVPLAGIVAQSFRTNRSMLAGAPDWTASTRYDITGKGPDPTVENPEVWEMMRSLLIDRFHLQYHIEHREMPVYALTVLPRGHTLTAAEKGRCAKAIKDGLLCGGIPGPGMPSPPYGLAIHNMPIGALITAIGQRAGRPIVDHTGLDGRYDAVITWVPEGVKLEDLDVRDVPREYRPQNMSLSEALEKQAGLRLEPGRASMPVLVIDSISRPDPN